jgi:hypothetical protein
MLNDQQQEAKKLIEEYIKNPKGTFGLLGAGGTGKTYLITSIKNSEKFLFLAPTNKAVNELTKGLRKNGVIKPNTKTVDSYFKFKSIKDENNKTVYSYTLPLKDIPKVIVVDECSMLQDKHIEMLLKISQKTALILIGDNMQLPPVLSNENKELEKRDSNGFLVSQSFLVMDKTFTLTKQNRQNEDSELFKLINAFRSKMTEEFKYSSMVNKKVNNKDILYFDYQSKGLTDFIKDNQCIAVTFKNNTADFYNYKIGRTKSGNPKYNLKSINIGESLIFDKFYRNDKVTFYTSEQVEVIDIYKKELIIEIPYCNSEKSIQEFALVKNEIGFPKEVWLKNTDLHNKVYSKYYNKRVKFYNEFKNNDCEESKNKLIELNTFFSDFKNKFASLNKPYSMTSHKSQGSTFDYVIIPIYDFNKKEHKDSHQLMYVAMSRAKKGIVFVNGVCNFSKNNYRVMFTEEERCLIAGSQKWICKCCEKELFDGSYDIDHINPLNQNGTNEINNLQALCKECHKTKTKTDKI